MAQAAKRINERYEILRPLGSGGMGEVLLVKDLLEGENNLRALKLLHADGRSDEILAWFKREFSTLASLHHAGLARVYDFGRERESEQPFYTSEFVAGEDLFAATRDKTLTEKIALLSKVCEALEYIHHRGILHNDLKTENILVEARSGAAKIVDFGLSQFFRERRAGVRKVYGTPAYLAPELLRGEPPSFQTDLFALGMILYKILAGRLPFRDAATAKILTTIEKGTLEKPRVFNPELSMELERLILRLLAKSPSERPRSAVEVYDQLQRLAGGKVASERRSPATLDLEAMRLVGRERERQALRRFLGSHILTLRQSTTSIALEHLAAGGEVEAPPVFAVLEGKMGQGKSALLKSLKLDCQVSDVPFLLVECHPNAPPLAPIRRALLQLRGLLRDDSPTRLHYAPFLEAVEAEAEKSKEDFSGFDRAGFFAYLEEFLRAAFRELPFVWAFDDYEEADELTRAFFQYQARFARQRQAREFAPVIFAVSGERSKFFAAGKESLWCELAPFTEGECKALLDDFLQPEATPKGLAAKIAAACGGNPLFIKALLREWIAGDVLRREKGVWNVAALEKKRVEIPSSLQQILATRLRALGGLERDVLDFLALLDQPLALGALQGVLREGADRLETALATLAQQEILRALPGRQWVFSERAFFTVVSEEIQDLPEKSRRAAEFLETWREKPVEKLARLFSQAGEARRSSTYALRAAHNAFRLFAHEQAAEFFHLALEQGRIAGEAALEIEALCGLGDTLWRQGKRQQALEFYATLLATSDATEANEKRALALRAAGIVHREQGETEKSLASFREGIAACGTRHLARRAELTAHIGLTQALAGEKREALAAVTRALEMMEEKEISRREAGVYVLAAEVSTRLGHVPRAEALNREALKISEAREDRRGVVIALSNLATLAAVQGDYAGARKILRQNLELARAMGDAQRTCGILLNLGNLEYLAGALRAAAEHFQSGLELALWLEKPSWVARLETALGQLEMDRGNYLLGYRHLQTAERLRKEEKDSRGYAIVLQGLAGFEFQMRRFSRALEMLAKAAALSSEPEFQTSLLLRRCEILLALADRDGLAKVLGEAESALNASAARAEQRLTHAIFRAQAKLLDKDFRGAGENLAAVESIVTECFDETLKFRHRFAKLEARRAAGVAEAAAWEDFPAFEAELEHLENPEWQWRGRALQGEILEHRGEKSRAIEALRQGRRLLEALETRLEPAWRESWKRDPEKKRLEESLERLSKTSEYVHEQLAEFQTRAANLERLLDINRQLAANWTDRTRLLDFILDTALQLTSARRGFLVIRREGRLEVAAARKPESDAAFDPTSEFSRSIVNDVLATGLPQVLYDAGGQSRFGTNASVVALQLRSVLCVPLRAGVQVVGAIYVDDDERRGLFSEPQVDLALAMADQAVLALQQAETLWEKQAHADQLTRDLTRSRAILQTQQKALEWKYSYDRLVGGKSPRMHQVFSLLDSVIPTKTAVLIEGESGTGKELVAQAIHYNGPRKEKPFVSLNCSGLNPALLESELFGHLKGSFTGADFDKEGLFVVAHGGSLFLDEIADMPPEVQTKLLRVLQDGEVRPLGATKSVKVDVRIIAASNRALRDLVSEGRFREDLYYRLNVVSIGLPPLRERREDLDLLIDFFLTRFAKEKKATKKSFTTAALQKLHAYGWPGNVRELLHLVEALTTLQRRKRLDLDDLPSHIRTAGEGEGEGRVPDLESAKEGFMREYLQALIRDTGGNISEAARRAGIYRKSLYRMLQKYGIEP